MKSILRQSTKRLRPSLPSTQASFSTSTSRLAKEDVPPPEDKTVAGRSPFQAFVDVLKDEVRKNREWQDSVKQLAGERDKVADSETMKKAREVYERARLTASINENPRLKAAAEELKKAGIQVNDAVSFALKGMEENALVRGSREALAKAASVAGQAALTASAPLRKTETYKAVAAEITEALDEAGTNVRYGGYVEKEDRRRRREKRLERAGKGADGLALRAARVKANPDAGGAIQLHATANEPVTSRFAHITPKPVSDLLSSLGTAYADSENPVVSTVRSVTSTIGRFFDETETARVTRWVKELDPAFTTEGFLRDLREYIVPELVDAYVNCDQVVLKTWCSEATYNVMMAMLGPYLSPTLISESRVVDIRDLDIMQAKVLENDLHVYIISWRTQEILAFRDLKTGEITEGSEDQLISCGYVAVMTRLEDELDNPITGGWKIIDMARRGA